MLPLLPVNEGISHRCVVSAYIVFDVVNQIIFAIIQLKEKQILFIITCYEAC